MLSRFAFQDEASYGMAREMWYLVVAVEVTEILRWRVGNDNVRDENIS